MNFQYDCIEIDLDTKSELNRIKRHFDCTKFDADGKSDCMNAETCRNSELELDRMKSDSEMKSELDCMHFETCRKVDFNCHNRRHHYFIFAFDLCMNLNRSHSIENINQT